MSNNESVFEPRDPSPYLATWEPESPSSCPETAVPVAYERLSSRIADQDTRFTWLADGLGLFLRQSTWHCPGRLIGERALAEPALDLRLSLRGQTRLRFAGKAHTLTPRRAVIQIARPGDRYEARQEVGEANRHLALLVTRTRLRELCPDEDLPTAVAGIADPHPKAETVMMATTPEIGNLAAGLVETAGTEPLWRLRVAAQAHQLLAKLFFILQQRDGVGVTPPRSPRELERARKARNILMASLDDPPRVEDLARRVGLSQRQLNHCFRTLYGNTVLQSLTQWRLARAQTLLRQDGLGVKQIAYALGYRHPENFILAFTRHVGMSPTHFRAWQLRPSPSDGAWLPH